MAGYRIACVVGTHFCKKMWRVCVWTHAATRKYWGENENTYMLVRQQVFPLAI